VPIVRRGRRKLVPVAALEAWLVDNAEPLLPAPAARPAKRRRAAG
jgi:hypothetical protein